MNLHTRKPVFGISKYVRLKPANSATETRIMEFARIHFRYYSLQEVNNKGDDQTVGMSLVGLHLCCLHAAKSGFLPYVEADLSQDYFRIT